MKEYHGIQDVLRDANIQWPLRHEFLSELPEIPKRHVLCYNRIVALVHDESREGKETFLVMTQLSYLVGIIFQLANVPDKI